MAKRPDAPASPSKFDKIFSAGAPEPMSPPTSAAETERPPPQSVKLERMAKSIGRPPGKRSDPAWKQFSVLLKKQTQRDAVTMLRGEAEESRDLSDLVQELLEQWIGERRT